MPHTEYDDPTNRINRLLDDIEEKIGLDGNLTLKCGVNTLEGRQFVAEWRRTDAEQIKRTGAPSGLRSVHGYWIEETLRKVLYFEEEVEDAWKREDADKAEAAADQPPTVPQ